WTSGGPLVQLPELTPWFVQLPELTPKAALQARLPLVIVLWAAGVGALALRMVLGLWWVRQRSRPGQYLEDPAWQRRLDHLAERLGVARRVTLGIVADLASPVTAGWWRPIVLVPAALVAGMPPDLLEALLAHEMAHIKRFDYLVNLVQGAIEILLFYHPTVWWLSNRIRIEREQIADDLAVRSLGEPRRLALALSELDLFQLTHLPLAQAAHGGNLMLRIKRLIRPGTEPLNWKMALPILGLSAACAVFYAQAEPAPAPTTAPAPAKRAATATVNPAAAPSKSTHSNITLDRKSRADAYAIVHGAERSINMNGSSADINEIERAKRSINGDFLWFRDGGQAYLVQDPGVLSKALELWAPVDKLGAEMDVHGKEMEKHGKVMEELGHQMETAARDKVPARAESQKFNREMRDLGRQQGELGREMQRMVREQKPQAEVEKLERTMEALERKMEAAQHAFDAKFEKMDQSNGPMEALSRQMDEASKPMDALGKQMDVLGKQMDVLAKQAEQQLRALIKEAQSRGLAAPAPRG
ncbi:MAG: M56 family metallopeptidase, partial [Pseudomonadota bacterium]